MAVHALVRNILDVGLLWGSGWRDLLKSLGAEAHDHDHHGFSRSVLQRMMHGRRDVEIILCLQGHLLVVILCGTRAAEDHINLVFSGILHGGASSMGIDNGFTIPRHAHYDRSIGVALPKQRLIVACRSGDVRGFLRGGGSVAMQPGRIDAALLRMKQRYARRSNDCENESAGKHGQPLLLYYFSLAVRCSSFTSMASNSLRGIFSFSG